METKSIVCFMLAFFPVTLSQCPPSTNTLRRIGKTRYYIIQNTQHRGDFVTIEQARQDCSNYGLKLATVKNMLSLAVVGRPLEKMAFKERMKDTWYWLDAKYDIKSEKYYWGDNINDELKYTMILYRTPRPIGVSSHITYNNVYQRDQDKPQCLTLALPWLGSADHHLNTTVFFGHQTSFDERDCKSQQKRHAMCEASKKDCQSAESNPYVLDEEKQDYFDEGNWIFGDRKYIVNWKQKTFNDSKRYCKSLGLQLMNAGALEKFLIPHIKMWSREVTVSQFWTGMSYHDDTKQYMDSSGNIIADENSETNFTESEFQSRSSKNSPLFCVALSLAYELRSQMPCSNPSSSGCQWSFIRYAPANCNNYHGTICQHPDYDEREVKWYPNFKTNLDDVLKKTALTTVFGYKGNTYVLRSKYKQTFGVCYCPKGFRMIRSDKNSNLAWSIKPVNTAGKEIYEYDYTESYWMVDKDSYNKDINSKCTISFNDKGTRKFKEIKCADWYFYLCEKLGRRPTRQSNFIVNKAHSMKWEEGPQPRVYPHGSTKVPTIYDTLCPCKLENNGNEWDSLENKCVKRPKDGTTGLILRKHFCRRFGDNIFNSVGGVIRNLRRQNNNCTIEKVIVATMFRNLVRFQDSKGLIQEQEFEPWRRWNLSRDLWTQREVRVQARFVPTWDRELYKIQHGGNVSKLPTINQSEKDGCATRLFDTFGNGSYQISLKLLDSLDPAVGPRYKRAYNMLLNGMYIAREFNPNDYTPRDHGIELLANFWIHENGRKVELEGYSPTTVERPDRKLKLDICHSFCARIGYPDYDANWMMNAISIVKFARQPDDPCQCKLRNSSKEYNTVVNGCVNERTHPGTPGCSSYEFSYDHAFCQRYGRHIYYAISGEVCNSHTNFNFTKYCKIRTKIYAVNFHGASQNDSRGILHSRLTRPNLTNWRVQPSTWVEQPSRLNVTDVPKADEGIYKSWASGSWANINKTTRSVAIGCAVLRFQVDGDGTYEISMKTGEVYWPRANNFNRTFSIMLNNEYIVKEFVVERYRLSPNGLELIQLFRIVENGSALLLQGHPRRHIPQRNNLRLEFCHSTCESTAVFVVDPNWVMYGLSIIKYDV